MPLSLFGNKFSPKKTPPRRAQSLSNLHLDASQTKEEFGPDLGPVKLKLGGSEIAFDNGMWVPGMACIHVHLFTTQVKLSIATIQMTILSYSILRNHMENQVHLMSNVQPRQTKFLSLLFARKNSMFLILNKRCFIKHSCPPRKQSRKWH